MGLEATLVSESAKYDVIIVGGGIAALTASIYLKRANLKVGFIESNIPGGKVVNEQLIENIPGFLSVNGADYISNIFDHVTAHFDVEYIYGNVVNLVPSKSDKYLIYTEDGSLRMAKAILIATGSSEKKLDIPGEEEYAQRGVSYCAVCDGTLTKDKDVVVVGGGNSAITNALYLSNIANSVTIVHRRDQFTADSVLFERIKDKKNIKVLSGQEIAKINGDDAKVTSCTLKDGVELKADFIFVYIGSTPLTQFLSNEIKKDDNGFIIVNKQMQTNWQGVFSAGDCISKNKRQITMAQGEATAAALEIIDYIAKNPNL